MEKTKVVYTGKSNKHDGRGHELSRKFTFLGYDFKPRMVKGRMTFTPGIGKGALARILDKVKAEFGIQHISKEFVELALRGNQIIRGWINYYGHFRRSDLYKMALRIDVRILAFLKRKYAKLSSWQKAWEKFNEIKRESPRMFCHWYMIGSGYMTTGEFGQSYKKFRCAIRSQMGGAV